MGPVAHLGVSRNSQALLGALMGGPYGFPGAPKETPPRGS